MQNVIEEDEATVALLLESEQRLVPLISWVRAGSWSDPNDEFQPGDAEDWLVCPRACTSSSYALRVRGDSMTAPLGSPRSYPDGSIIFVDPERIDAVNGDRVIARLQETGEVTFKVYRSNGSKHWLQPLNAAHPNLVGEFEVIGTVVGLWSE